jgi:hypothetical protein
LHNQLQNFYMLLFVFTSNFYKVIISIY